MSVMPVMPVMRVMRVMPGGGRCLSSTFSSVTVRLTRHLSGLDFQWSSAGWSPLGLRLSEPSSGAAKRPPHHLTALWHGLIGRLSASTLCFTAEGDARACLQVKCGSNHLDNKHFFSMSVFGLGILVFNFNQDHIVTIEKTCYDIKQRKKEV